MEDMIKNLEAKLDKLDDRRKKLERKLENKRFQLEKVEALIDGIESLEDEED